MAASTMPYLPRSVGSAAEAILSARGRAEELQRVLDRRSVPMVLLDGSRRHVEANRPARLAFRLSLAELRRYAVDDLTPPHLHDTLRESWRRLLETGCVGGWYEVASPDGGRLDTVYYALADALPGLHAIAFAPAGWPDGELSAASELDANARSLTPREREVLRLAAEGLSGPSIAERLFLSPATVKTHFSNIYEKLQVSGRAAAVARALRAGLIE